MIYEKIKKPALTTLYLSGLCLVSTALTGVLLVIFNSSDYVLMVPILSGFLHGSIEHLLMNLVVIFSLMLIEGNYFKIWKIFYYTTIISSVYLLLLPLGFPVSIGMSGFSFFLLARAMFLIQIKWKDVFRNIAVISILTYELVQIKNPDGISHGSHFIGFVLGIFSLYLDGRLHFLGRRS